MSEKNPVLELGVQTGPLCTVRDRLSPNLTSKSFSDFFANRLSIISSINRVQIGSKPGPNRVKVTIWILIGKVFNIFVRFLH